MALPRDWEAPDFKSNTPRLTPFSAFERFTHCHRQGEDAMKPMKLAAAILLATAATQAPAVGRLADLSIYDRNAGQQLPVYWHEGRAWIAGKPGNEYAIRLNNRGREELLAVVSVDGVNAVSGETANPQQSGYVLAPRRTFEVAGWRKSLSNTAAFYFTSLPDSYAARTDRPDDVGVIGVGLFRKKNQPPPAPVAPLAREAQSGSAAPSASAGGGNAGASGAGARAEASADARREAQPMQEQKLGTGHGRTEASPAQYVQFERATREPAETVSIYYDRYENLVARGIVPAPVPARPALPRPFPGFVPDPR